MLELDASIPNHRNAELDVVSQIKLAFANPLPLTIGALIGALVPIATYTVGHAELEAAGWASVPGAIVVGGCAFSAITVYKWGRRAFDSALKAVGFVVLAEGVMSFSHVAWLSLVVLGFLTAINAVANGANLAMAHLAANPRPVVEPVATVLLPLPEVVQTTVIAPVSSLPPPPPVEAVAPVAKKPARKRSKSKGIKVEQARGQGLTNTESLN